MKLYPKKSELYKDLALSLLFIAVFFLISQYRLGFLAWFVNIPLLLLVYKKPIKKAAIVALPAVIIACAISFTWIAKYNWNSYLGSTIIISSFLYFFSLLFSILSRKVKGYLQILAAPFVYSLLMIIYSFSIINSYWADWAIFWPMAAPLIWFVGSNGITFLIVLMHSAIALWLLKKDKQALASAIIIALVMTASSIYSYTAKPEGEKVKVALIQGNFKESWAWRNMNAKKSVLDAYENLSLEASKTKPGLIVWPEYAIADEVINDKGTMDRLSRLARNSKSYLIIGSLEWHDSFFKDERNRYDLALIFNPNGELIGKYSSIKPLPFEKWVLPGKEAGIFNESIGNFGVSLCYEETQGLAKDYSSKGANFLVSIANNNLMDNTPGIYLTSLYTNIRAAENGKYLVRATNTGITKIINPYGKVEAQLEPYTRSILIGDIYLNSKNTFYTKYGNLILYIVLLALAVLFIKEIKFIRK